MGEAVGILVFGDNHLIVRGRRPTRNEALALGRYWSVIRIGAEMPPALREWGISTREFREDLTWAVIVPGEGKRTEAVAQLLSELAARGVAIEEFR